MNRMTKLMIGVVAGAATLAAVLAVAVPAGATTPIVVHIEGETSLLGEPGPFVASGPAVDDGLVCASGTVVEEDGNANGFNVSGFSPTGFTVRIVKHFSCDDSSGDFFVRLEVRIDFRFGGSFQWNVVDGTGAYADLHGAGSGSSFLGCGPDCVVDLYDGELHVD